MPIRAIIVDLGGVLLDMPPTDRRYTRWEMHLKLPSGEIHSLLREAGFFADADVGRFSEEGMITRLAAILHVNEVQALQFFKELKSAEELNVELASFLKSLRPRYKVATLSNAWPGARKGNVRHRLEEIVDLMIYSCEEGVAKPDPAIYQLVCRRLDVRPEEALFLDDTARHVEGARRAGLLGLHFESTAQAIVALRAALANAGEG